MSATTIIAAGEPTTRRGPTTRARAVATISRAGVLVALAALLLFGALRYDHFLSAYNLLELLRYNSMFALIALGMTFVIMTGGIDLSVGSVVAMSSVVSAMASPYGLAIGVAAGVGAGALAGLLNGVVIARLRVLPFIATLATMQAASGTALLLANNASVAASYDTSFTTLGQGDWLGIPIPALIAAAAFTVASVVLNFTGFGRHTLAVGGGEEASRLMGLPVERVKLLVYVMSGALAGLSGVILASQFGSGQPTEGAGWELFAIASVVVGGTLLTGGVGSVLASLTGALLLGLIFNVLNFENGYGVISLSAYWQSVIRGAFLLIVVVLQSRLARRRPG